MAGLSIADVARLALSSTTNAEDRLEQVYVRSHDRAVTLAQGSFAVAGLILTPLLAAVFDPHARLKDWVIALYLGGAALAALGGLWRHRRVVRLDHELMAALRLYDRIRRAAGLRP